MTPFVAQKKLTRNILCGHKFEDENKMDDELYIYGNLHIYVKDHIVIRLENHKGGTHTGWIDNEKRMKLNELLGLKSRNKRYKQRTA